MTVFVTALFAPKYRSLDDYLKYFDMLANTGISIILWLDNRLRDLNLSYPNVDIHYTDLDTSRITSETTLPTNRNEEKDTTEYMCVQYMKLKLLVRSMEVTDSEYLAWIDFGVFHMFDDHKKQTEKLVNVMNTSYVKDKLIAPGCWPDVGHLIERVSWRFCGSFLLGHRDLLPKALKTQEKILDMISPKLTWEVNVWGIMDKLFHIYKSDHNDSLLDIPVRFAL